MNPRGYAAAPAASPVKGWAPLPASGDLGAAYLHAGHLIVSVTPCRITTILGSCVAVGLWDPSSGIGGLNHFLLPHSTGTGVPSTRYGDEATRALIDAVVTAGANRRTLQAKMFGGACVLVSFQGAGWHLGTQNVEAARQVLRGERIRVCAEDVEGARGRKLIFQTHDGSAWVRAL